MSLPVDLFRPCPMTKEVAAFLKVLIEFGSTDLALFSITSDIRLNDLHTHVIFLKKLKLLIFLFIIESNIHTNNWSGPNEIQKTAAFHGTLWAYLRYQVFEYSK
jgi:hypothetical protein